MRQTIYLDSVIAFKDKNKKRVELMLIISTPPNCKSSVQIDYLSKDNKVQKTEIIISQPYYSISRQFSDSLYKIKFTATQYDSLTKDSYEQSSYKIVKAF